MPLYEYQCDACGHRFESIQKFSDAPLDRCPKCAGGLRKLQSAPAIQFKGAGWYITDYAKKDGVAAGKTADGSGETTASAGKSSGDSGAPASTDTGATASAAPAPAGDAKPST